MKGKLIMSKRFAKFYMTEFQPITKLEANDLNKTRLHHRAYTVAGAAIFGFMSLRLRRASTGSLETAGISRESSLPLNILSDLMMGFCGFIAGQLLSTDYIYKHRQYVLERIYHEQSRGIRSRAELLQKPSNELLDEYPFFEYVGQSDKQIIEDRFHPEEVVQSAEQLR